MPIDWIYGLLGGLMIGCAGALYLLINGRIMGVSGILGGIVDGTERSSLKERLAFLAGLIGAPILVGLFVKMPSTNVTSSIGILIIAGLLVGFGTRLGSGCTSGHGVCGMSRLSIRSIVATVMYIGAGAATIIAARFVGVL